ncbi:MAG: hypothetical protein AAGB32_03895 [Pseudomonadota bacterium]
MIKNFKNWPFEYISGNSYLIGNITLMINGGLTSDAQLLPTIKTLQALDPSAWQSLAGFSLILSAIGINFIRHFPDGATKVNALIIFLGNFCLLISGYTQEAFWAHAFGLMPVFIASFLLLQGNKINQKKGFYSRYPLACASVLFLSAAPPLLYNAILSQDWVLTFVLCCWVTGHIFFALSDRNFQKKLFG